MNWLASPVAGIVRAIIGCMCRVDDRDMARVPRGGGFILAFNHVNFLEAPLIVTRIWPRAVASLAKRETWDNPFVGWLTSLYGGIPVRRGTADSQAMRMAIASLDSGAVLLFAPEGTRNRDGRLGPAQQGIVSLALHAGAPILPVAVHGHAGILHSLRLGRRPLVTIRVGEAFRVLAPPRGEARAARAEAAAEIMRRIARLLPEESRGAYADGLDAPERRIAGIA